MEMKLCGMSYKMNDNRELCGLVFHFYNGQRSKQFETTVQPKQNEWKQIEFDINDRIDSIEVCLSPGATKETVIRAIRFKNADGIILQFIGDGPDLQLSTTGPTYKKTWAYRRIPRGK